MAASPDSNAVLTTTWWQRKLQAAEAPARLAIAYSGGLDSTVLLHSLSQVPGVRVTALHVDHGLHAESERWAQHCCETAERLRLEFQQVRVEVDPGKGGIEAAARDARYQALLARVPPDGWLLTGHHLRDQAETVMLRLLRGAGTQGLRGTMPIMRRDGRTLWRPMLRVSPEQLEQYARAHALNWIDDPSNDNPQFQRNWLRHEVMPQMRQRAPQLDESLARTAELMQETQELLEDMTQQWLRRFSLEGGQGLRLDRLRSWSWARQKLVLRAWLADLQPSSEQIERLRDELIYAAADRHPELVIQGESLARHQTSLWRLKRWATPNAADQQPHPLCNGRYQLPADAGWLDVQGDAQLLHDLDWRLPAGGERLKTKDRRHHKSLKQLHQEASIPVWIRQRTPLIYRADALLSVGGVWNSAEFCELQRQGLKLRWQHDMCAEPRTQLRRDTPKTP